MNAPDITVLMPVDNGQEYLREAIESILNQTFTNFEYLIIKSYNDKRIRYLKNEKILGLIATLNKGFKLAKGIYIPRTDADDINYLNRLALQYEYEANKGFICAAENLLKKLVAGNEKTGFINGEFLEKV